MALTTSIVQSAINKIGIAFQSALTAFGALRDGGKVKDPIIRSITQMIAEGRSRNEVFSGENFLATATTITAGSTQSPGGGFFIRPGKRFYSDSLTITANGSCLVTITISTEAAQTWWPYLGLANNSNTIRMVRFQTTFGPNGGAVTIPTNGYVMHENSSFLLTYKTTDTLTKNISYSFTGAEVPNEPNMDAKVKIAVFGDSTAWGNNLGNDAQGRAFLGNSQWSEVFRDNCRTHGVDAQILANNADDGRTMMEGFYSLITGFNKIKYDIAFVSYGMNDAVSTKYQTEAKFKEAATAWILERNKYNAGTHLVFMAPAATDDPDRLGSSRIANIRTWLSAVANDATIGGAANKVYYVDQSLVIPLNADQTQDLNYKSAERVVGSTIRVHYSGTGSTLIGNYLWDYLKAPLFNK